MLFISKKKTIVFSKQPHNSSFRAQSSIRFGCSWSARATAPPTAACASVPTKVTEIKYVPISGFIYSHPGRMFASQKKRNCKVSAPEGNTSF